MENPKTFLMYKIINHDKNGHDVLKHLEAKFLDDLAQIMQEFAEETVLYAIDLINKGETFSIGDKIIKSNQVINDDED